MLFRDVQDGRGVVIITNGNRGARLYTEILRSFSKNIQLGRFQTRNKKYNNTAKKQLELVVVKYVHLPDNKYQEDVKILGDFSELTQLWNNIQFPIYSKNQHDFFEGEEGMQRNFGDYL